MACHLQHKASPACMCGVHNLCKHTHCILSCYTCNTQVLCTHLLHEASKGATSFWQHYIAQLPTNYTLTMAFRQRHIEALQTPYAQSTAQAAADRAFGDWTAAQPLLQGLGKSPNSIMLACCQAHKPCARFTLETAQSANNAAARLTAGLEHVLHHVQVQIGQQHVGLARCCSGTAIGRLMPLCIPLSTRLVLVPVSDMCVGN